MKCTGWGDFLFVGVRFLSSRFGKFRTRKIVLTESSQVQPPFLRFISQNLFEQLGGGGRQLHFLRNRFSDFFKDLLSSDYNNRFPTRKTTALISHTPLAPPAWEAPKTGGETTTGEIFPLLIALAGSHRRHFLGCWWNQSRLISRHEKKSIPFLTGPRPIQSGAAETEGEHPRRTFRGRREEAPQPCLVGAKGTDHPSKQAAAESWHTWAYKCTFGKYCSTNANRYI